MPHTVIVGAGTFGASLAWLLARAGREVTLVDQFEPGDARASSGGESRLLRFSHGADADYTRTARRAQALWRELEAEAGEALFVECGIAWFAQRADGWEAESERTMAALGIPVERLEPAAVERLFPSVGVSDLAFAVFEPDAGVMRAQRAVQALARQAAEHGARVVRGRARPTPAAPTASGGPAAPAPSAGPAPPAPSAAPAPSAGPAPPASSAAPAPPAASGGPAASAPPVLLDDGTVLEGDTVVWACGGWLGGLFPGVVELTVTRQELLFFDGGPAWQGVPGWVDYDRAMYGTGDLDGLGVKAALDAEGPPLDPDAALPPAGATEAHVRAYLAQRFPALADAPLREGRCCRYELSPDSHFIAAPHPGLPATWVLGGGSGHGFKHGPAMAELMIAALDGGEPLPARFALGERAPGRSFRTAGSGVSD